MAAALGKGAPVTLEYTGMRGSRNVTPAMACRRGNLRTCLCSTRTIPSHAEHGIAKQAYASNEKTIAKWWGCAVISGAGMSGAALHARPAQRRDSEPSRVP